MASEHKHHKPHDPSGQTIDQDGYRAEHLSDRNEDGHDEGYSLHHTAGEHSGEDTYVARHYSKDENAPAEPEGQRAKEDLSD